MLLSGTNQLIDVIEITLRGRDSFLTVYIDVFDNSLSHKWLDSLNHLLQNNYHLEKNYCFFGFVNSPRNGWYILDQINHSISAINKSDLDYQIDDYFSIDNCITDTMVGDSAPEGRNIIHDKFNQLHRYFEDLQGISGKMSLFFTRADPTTRWHIRQLNLLCHEFESWALSYRKELHAPEWVRPSQLMCWLHAPRFILEEEDYELFGIETINRPLGGVFVGVNKAIGKHHWEVFVDEGRDSRLDELTTSTLRSQSEAAGDFDIEWAKNPGEYHWQKEKLIEFKRWLIANNFDPNDKRLTIGHPQIGQVNLSRSFGTNDYKTIWKILEHHLEVYSIKTSLASAVYEYNWNDPNFIDRQIAIIGNKQ
jgi:hypothetical protein